MKPKLADGIVIRKENDFGILFDVNKNERKLYNEIAIDILNLCDGNHEISEIVEILAGQYSAEKEKITRDVLEFITEKKKENVII